MTLSTHIVVKDEVPGKELFNHCQSLLGDPDSQHWEIVSDAVFPDDWVFKNRAGQGLAAWLTVRYRPGQAWVTFDTAYRYRAPNGAHAGDLHAWLVQQCAAWLEQRGLSYEWQNELTNEWYDSAHPDALATLGDPRLGALGSWRPPTEA